MQNAPVGQIPASRPAPTPLPCPVHPRPGPSASLRQSGGELALYNSLGWGPSPSLLKELPSLH